MRVYVCVYVRGMDLCVLVTKCKRMNVMTGKTHLLLLLLAKSLRVRMFAMLLQQLYSRLGEVKGTTEHLKRQGNENDAKRTNKDLQTLSVPEASSLACA